MSGPSTHDFATSFDSVAAQYGAARPGYPPELFAAVEELAGRPLRGADVLDVGAGTGIASRLLREQGARVTAVEPGPAMAAELRAATPDLPLVRADGNLLPFPDDSFDVVTYAQSWHWTDPARSVPEALRVLRPGGTLALWRNLSDKEVPWAAEQEERLARVRTTHPGRTDNEAPDVLLAAGLDHERRRMSWTRPVRMETHLAHLGSHSFLAVLPAAESRRILAAEREALLARFPDGVVPEAYVVDLVTVERAGDVPQEA